MRLQFNQRLTVVERGVMLCVHALDLALIYVALSCSWQVMPLVLAGMTAVYSTEGYVACKRSRSRAKYPYLVTLIATAAFFAIYSVIGFVLVLLDHHLLDGVARVALMMIAYTAGKHYIATCYASGGPQPGDDG